MPPPVDGRTADALDLLARPGASVLLEALSGRAAVVEAERLPTPTVRRRLTDLVAAGAISPRRAGRLAPGTLNWSLTSTGRELLRVVDYAAAWERHGNIRARPRAGTRALSLMADPLTVATLHALASGAPVVSKEQHASSPLVGAIIRHRLQVLAGEGLVMIDPGPDEPYFRLAPHARFLAALRLLAMGAESDGREPRALARELLANLRLLAPSVSVHPDLDGTFCLYAPGDHSLYLDIAGGRLHPLQAPPGAGVSGFAFAAADVWIRVLSKGRTGSGIKAAGDIAGLTAIIRALAARTRQPPSSRGAEPGQPATRPLRA